MKHLIFLCAVMCIPFSTVLGEKGVAHKTDFADLALQSSVRLNFHLNCPASGVIISAQKQGKRTILLVLSTGHMKERSEPEIEIFYQNGKRLKTPIIVKGRILLLVENNFRKGVDFSVIRAEVPATGIAFTPMAPPDFKLTKGDNLLSLGCDLGEEPKCHKVVMDNYPDGREDFNVDGWSKVGRSGGGIFTLDAKYVVGVCWGGWFDAPKTMCTSHRVISKVISQYEITCDIE
jgi:hypothetical protein